MEGQIKQETKYNNIPPILVKRNEFGLLENVNYVFNEDSSINWRAMVPTELLYINQQYRKELETKYNKKLEELDIVNDKIEDKYLILKLAATRYLLNLRGYTEVNYEIRTATDTYAAVKCYISFVSCYENCNLYIAYSDCACATFDNTNGFGQKYLVEMASNRALARAVRSFLNISIVSQAELSGNKESNYSESAESTPNIYVLFQNALDRKGKGLPDIKKRMQEEGENVDHINKITDIPENKVFEFLERVKKLKDKS